MGGGDSCSFKAGLDGAELTKLYLVTGPPLLSFDYCLVLPLWIVYKSRREEKVLKALHAQADFQEELLPERRESQVQFAGEHVVGIRQLIRVR